MILTNDNLDEKLKEFFEFKAFEDPMATPIAPLPRMLFLDDRTKRIEAARKKYAQLYDVTYVHNAKECLRYLCRQEWDILSLDHDLNGDDFQHPDETSSGMEVVRYMKTWMEQYSKPEVWIHSSNLFAANAMIDILRQYGFRAYYRRFEYDDEKKFGDAKVSYTPEKLDKLPHWESDLSIGAQRCSSCKDMCFVDKNNQCYDCWNRELKQCE